MTSSRSRRLRRRYLGGNEFGFSPTDIAGLTLWLKGDAGTYQGVSALAEADGDPVARWDDQSGAAWSARQDTEANKPVLKTGANGINGRNVVRYDGVNDYHTGDILPSLDSFTMFIVRRRNGSPTGYSHIFALGFTDFTTTGTQFAQVYAPSGGVLKANFDTAALDLDALANLNTTAGQDAIRKDNSGGGTSALWLDTSAQDTGTGNQAIASNPAFLGGWNSNHFQGDIGEIIIYDTALTDENRQRVESYLRSRWGTP